MLTLYTIFGMFVGFEGYENGKVYVGIYTPKLSTAMWWVLKESTWTRFLKKNFRKGLDNADIDCILGA